MTDLAERHNGWANRPTWCVGMWLNSERETQALAEACATDTELREMVEAWAAGYAERATQGHPWGLFVDLVGMALGAVDWYQLWESLRPEDEGGAS